ncbi:nucleotide-binding domain-containing protein, partial [Auricularia subglabra TFB-10046 SS5]
MAHIVVIGAGVVGLSTAIRLQERGYDVTIIADALPSDAKSVHYTSPWAGAQHVSFADHTNPRQLEMDRATFKVMWDMSAPGSETEGCFLRITQSEYYPDAPPAELTSALDNMPDFRFLTASDLPPGVQWGVEFRTVTIDVPVYLPYLLERFLARGGRVVRQRVQHVDQVLRGAYTPASPHALVVCAGLGARFLGGVEDGAMHPVRGQVLLVRAPWITHGATLASRDKHASAAPTYIIPRRSGDVILGGVMEADDWYPHARPETTTAILERNLALCPELAPPAVRENGRAPTVEDLRSILVEEGCGFRPGRTGGIRLEVERGVGGVPIVHNYGHAGQGYQSSWGSADIAVALLEEALKAPAAA